MSLIIDYLFSQESTTSFLCQFGENQVSTWNLTKESLVLW
jgi:hypothetical protein